jgi:hypothetical protein
MNRPGARTTFPRTFPSIRAHLVPLSYAVCMPKRTKVLPIAEAKYRLIAMDERAHRIILGIGGQRFAIDLLSRVSLLPSIGGGAVNKKRRKFETKFLAPRRSVDALRLGEFCRDFT